MKKILPALIAPALLISGCSTPPPAPLVPRGGIPDFSVGTWQISSFGCSVGDLTSSLEDINATITAGKRYLWYNISASGQVQARRHDPFFWSPGSCQLDIAETWGVGAPGQVTLSGSAGGGQIMGVLAPASTAKAACPASYSDTDPRTFLLAQTSTGFSLTAMTPMESAGYCKTGALVWNFAPNPIAYNDWPSHPGDPNSNPPPINLVALDQTVRAALNVYSDQWGLITPYPATSSGNGLLYLGEAMVLLKTLGIYKPTDKTWFQNSVQVCEVEPGLLRRSPANTDQEGPDDYVGVAAGSALVDPTIAQKILVYGQTHDVTIDEPTRNQVTNAILAEGAALSGLDLTIPLKYVYNNVRPGTLQFPDGKLNLSAWLGRQLNLVAHFFYAAGMTPPALNQAVWVGAVASALNKKATDQDSWFLSWLLITAAQGRTISARDTEIAWRVRYEQVVPGGRNQLFRTYFGNADHPLARYWPDEDFSGLSP